LIIAILKEYKLSLFGLIQTDFLTINFSKNLNIKTTFILIIDN
jgi:hypothetical protein